MFRSLRRQLTIPADGALLCVVVTLSLCLFVASESAWYDDSTTYAADILAGRLIEPGHLLWRPAGRLIGFVTGSVTYSAVLWRLQFLCLLASVLVVAAMYLLVVRLYGRLAALVAATLMAVSNGFWSYAFSGGSYSLSMLFAILALRCAISARCTATTGTAAFAAGALGGLSAATWGIQILVGPALWLALVLTPAHEQAPLRQHLRNTPGLVGGYLLTLVVPLLAAFLIQTRGHGVASAGTHGETLNLASWLASSRHGVCDLSACLGIYRAEMLPAPPRDRAGNPIRRCFRCCRAIGRAFVPPLGSWAAPAPPTEYR